MSKSGGFLTMVSLPKKWITELASKPETGMGYHVVSIVLRDGRRIEQAVVVEGRITEIKGYRDVRFSADDIAELIVTHDKWNFKKG